MHVKYDEQQHSFTPGSSKIYPNTLTTT